MIVELNVASNLYLTFPVYVSFGTWNKPVNHLPIAVSGIKLEIIIERNKAITKLVKKFNQSIVVKLIVKIPQIGIKINRQTTPKQKKPVRLSCLCIIAAAFIAIDICEIRASSVSALGNQLAAQPVQRQQQNPPFGIGQIQITILCPHII